MYCQTSISVQFDNGKTLNVSFLCTGEMKEKKMLDKWNNTCAAARQLSMKTHFLSLHGTSDAIVPLWCGRKLFDAVACEHKRFVHFNGGGHNDLLDQPTYIQTLEEFYARL